jgi:acetaldehyde dehydrogenase/alcohol dehydrogenase
MAVATIQELDALIARVKADQTRFAEYTQEQVDVIFRQAALAAVDARIPLARMAVAETGMGVLEDKVVKNHFASEYIYNAYRDERTCGVLEEDRLYGTLTIAEPVGLIAGIIPTTNPTSTTIFKALICLKTRNGIVFSPHPRAKASTCAAARLMLEAAAAAGAPAQVIGWIDEPTAELTHHLMGHPDLNLILATGGPGLVRAAYSSGKPAIGVGAGNTPVVIDETADIKRAVASILLSKTFDNGVVCASEQAVIVVDAAYGAVRERFASHAAHILDPDQCAAVRRVLVADGALNPAVVGQSAATIAGLAGIQVAPGTQVLVGEVSAIGPGEPFALEKLSPILGLYRARDFDDALAKAEALVALGGIGHTSALYTDQDLGRDRIARFGARMKTGRILVNTPTSQGGIGDLYNFRMAPSLTLGCGSWGGNSVSENVGPRHLLNRKTVAKRAENMLGYKLPRNVFFRRGCLPFALEELRGRRRAIIVTDRYLFDHGRTDDTARILKGLGLEVEVFHEVEADPTLAMVRRGVARCRAFEPDVIVALGGGSPMDAAKIMGVLYEHPEIQFEDIALRFMDIRKRIYRFPRMGVKAALVAIPTTSGTGSEVTPFAVVTDEATGVKYPIADYELTPTLAIVDPDLVMDMPPSLTAYGGIDAVTHGLEAYVSVMASEYTDPQAVQGLRLLKEHLPAAYREGARNPRAREAVHNAATLVGIAFANAFLGVCHSMAHKLGAEFHLPHGLANALLVANVIRYNATDTPSKQTAFSQYDRPQARHRYGELAQLLGLPGARTAERIDALLEWVEGLKATLAIPASIQAAGVDESAFLARLDRLTEGAFDDQCTGTNPRFPLLGELRQLLLDSYYGRAYRE